MAIPESQLSRWSHHGPQEASIRTHEEIRRVLANHQWPRGMTYDFYLQGSYWNDTNIRGDSDVDVVLELNSIFNYDATALGEYDRNRLSASFDDYKSTYPVTVVIRQRWSQITVRLETEQSQSRSLAATFRVADLAFPELSYLYINEPKPDANSTMNTHRGTVDVEFKEGALEGHYYTGRGRMTNGIMHLTRDQRGLKTGR